MDFWKLVSDQECGVVVMLSGLKEKEEEVCAQYWPVDGDSLEYGEFLVTTVKTHRNEGYTQRVLTVTNPKVNVGTMNCHENNHTPLVIIM